MVVMMLMMHLTSRARTCRKQAQGAREESGSVAEDLACGKSGADGAGA